MQEAILQIVEFFSRGPAAPLILIGATYVAFFALFWRSPLFRHLAERIGRTLFYSERNDNGRSDIRAAIDDLHRKVTAQEKILQTKFDQAQLQKIDADVTQFLEESIKRKIEAEFFQEKEVEKLVSRNIKSNIDEHIVSFLQRLKATEVEALREQNTFLQAYKNASVNLDDVLEQQLRNTGRIKSIMMNLFVVVNISVMIVYMTGLAKMSDSVAYSFLGIYISLAAFIIYIYRAANFRSTVVIAIREDEKRYYDLLNYISRVCGSRKLDDRDADILRLILTNRAEREKVARHPYEVVLKGVSESNVQLGGGKFSVTKAAKKDS